MLRFERIVSLVPLSVVVVLAVSTLIIEVEGE
jgi:hypothetical protein